MTRRTLVSALWFASVYLTGEVIWSIAATPRALNLILGLAVAAIVFADPLRLFHPAGERTTESSPTAIALTRDPQVAPR